MADNTFVDKSTFISQDWAQDLNTGHYHRNGLVLLEMVNTPTGATVAFDSLDNTFFNAHLIVLDRVAGATDATTLGLQFATSGTYNTGATDYRYVYRSALDDGTLATVNSTGDDNIQIADDVGNVNDETINGNIWIYGLPNSNKPYVTWDVVWDDATSGAGIKMGKGAGKYKTAETNDGVRLIFSAGNFQEGNIFLYGIFKKLSTTLSNPSGPLI